jgi:hypothetical protein
MKRVDIIGPESFHSMPWRNGLGTTVELLRQDLPAGDGFAWRLSMADVTSDGEFSNFSGYDRTLLLLEGNGITLDSAGARQRLQTPLQAARFSGDDTTRASLHDGPVKDFNIMTLRHTCTASVASGTGQGELIIDDAADLLLVYAVDGDLHITSPQFASPVIPARHLLILHDPVEQALHYRGAGFIATQIFNLSASASRT